MAGTVNAKVVVRPVLSAQAGVKGQIAATVRVSSEIKSPTYQMIFFT